MKFNCMKVVDQNNFDKMLELRYEVFVKEQGVSIEEEIDEYDVIDHKKCEHFGLFIDNNIICCLRVFKYGNQIKIGRVATRKSYRGNGYMSELFRFLLVYLNNTYDDIKYLYLESQLQAIPFYKTLGFEAYGDIFLDAGIEHKKMKRQFISPFLKSRTNKRYYTVNEYFKSKYNHKVGRVMLDAGFTCPNIDGRVGYGGCSFCSIHGSGDFAGYKKDTLLEQYNMNYENLVRKWADSKAIAYFQAYSNTYSSIDNLRDKFTTFKDLDSCVGIAIGTRPDCLDEEKIKFLAELQKEVDIHLELGLQTTNEQSAISFNRGYTNECFTKTVKLLNQYNIKPIIHIINGLPEDSVDDYLNVIKYLNQFKIGGIKIHMLHIMKRTKMGKEFEKQPWTMLTKDEYVDIVVNQLCYLNPEVVVHRVTGDAPQDMLIEPKWTIDKTVVLNDIDKALASRNLYQGIYYEN